MKTIKKIGFLTLTAFTLLISSCSGDDNEGDGGGSNMATYIFATVDGESFKTFESQGFLSAQATKTGSGDASSIAIIGVSAEQSGMSMMLNGITAVGEYPINTQLSGTAIGYSNGDVVVSSASPCDGVTGTVTITVITAEKVEGTFTMTAKNTDCTQSRTVTNGKFRGTFATQ